VDAEAAKMLTLARAARARTGAVEGACLRDADGRTYAAAAVDLPSLSLSAVQVTVAMAACSGARGVEAVLVLQESSRLRVGDLAAVRDLAGPGVDIWLVAPDGSVIEQVS
jgi:hypothetical protein